jgi:predicted ester cyclase
MHMRAFVFAAMGLLFSAAAGAQTPTLETQNEQVVRRFLEAINHHDAKAAAAEFSEDAKNFGRQIGRKGMEDALVDIFNTFPDWHMEIEKIVASGDQVVVRCRVTGTHQGVGKLPLNGMPVGAAPTGKRFEVGHTHWDTLQRGQIVEHSANRDDLGMLRQLGLLPAVAAQ